MMKINRDDLFRKKKKLERELDIFRKSIFINFFVRLTIYLRSENRSWAFFS